MREISTLDYPLVHGGLTEKQTDSLMGKIGGYGCNAVLLASLAGMSIITWQTMLIGGVLAPMAKITGTYIMYENKEWVLEKAHDTGEYFQSYFA